MSGNWKRTIAIALAAAVVLICGIAFALAGEEEEEPPFIVVYNNVADLVVYVDGELSADLTRNSVICGEPVELTAPAASGGKNFSHWAIDAENGVTVSNQNPYTIAVNADTALYAVYGGTAESAQAVVAFTAKAKQDYLGEDSIRLTATYSLPSEQTATEIGIRYTDNTLLGAEDATVDLTDSALSVDGLNVSELLQSGSDSRVRETSGAASNAAGDWTLSLTSPGDNAYVYAMAFVKIGDNTVYSDLLKVRYGDLELGVMAEAAMGLPFNLPNPPSDSGEGGG